MTLALSLLLKADAGQATAALRAVKVDVQGVGTAAVTTATDGAKIGPALTDAARTAIPAVASLKTELASVADVAHAVAVEAAAETAKLTPAALGAKQSYEALRASLDPLYAASMRYAQALQVVDAALSENVISQKEAERSLSALGAQYLTAGQRAQGLGAAHQGAAGSVGNLVSQFNDIGMMIAAGQNPLQLAIQQGSQITQVIGPMGAGGAVKALGSALLGMLNPVNLVTYAVIAGGAAFVQWAMSGEEAANELEKSLEDVGKAVEDVKAKIATIKFGEKNTSVALVMDQMAMISAQLDVINEKYRESESLSTRQRLAEEAQLLRAQYGELDAIVKAYQAAVAEQERLANATAEARESVTTLFGVTNDLTGFLKDAGDAAEKLSASGPQGGWLAAAIADATTLGSKLWNAASAAAWLDKNKVGGTADLASQYKSYGEGRILGEQGNKAAGALYGGNYTAAEMGHASAKSGGASAAKAERDAVAELIAKLEDEAAIQRELDPVKAEMLKHRKDLAKATTEERARVEELIRAEQQLKQVEELNDFMNTSTMDLLKGLVAGGDEATNAMKRLGNAILDAAMQALLLGKGPLAGVLGISGGLFSAGAGAATGTGSLGLPMPFADGGMIFGAGGPRDDKIPMWGSAGEYMVNARATAKYKPLLDRINYGGDVPGFASGGMIGGGKAGAALGAAERALEVHNHIYSPTSNTEIHELVLRATKAGIEEYDREAMPFRVKDIVNHQRKVG